MVEVESREVVVTFPVRLTVVVSEVARAAEVVVELDPRCGVAETTGADKVELVKVADEVDVETPFLTVTVPVM